MKTKLVGLVCLFLLALSISNAWCETYNEVKVGTHSIMVSNDADGYDNDELAGFMLSYQRAITTNVAIRGGFYSDEHSDFSEVVASGVEIQALLGNNFTTTGGYVYAGLGLFNETWESSNSDVEFDFSGLLLSLGGGYRFNSVVIDFILNIRDSSDYEELINGSSGTAEVAAASASLSVGFCF